MKRKLKRILIVILLLIVVFISYVAFVTRHTKDMTVRQKILKAVYPAFIWFSKVTGKNNTGLANQKQPPVPFYSLTSVLNNGDSLDFNSLKGKKVLLVNTASDCGYTNQYEALEQLAADYKDKLVILAFPANDFKGQEKGTDEEIATFCRNNYNTTFPLMKKSVVIKTTDQNAVFQWLTDSTKNGWNNKPPTWNFTKFLVNEHGILTNYFGSSITPMSQAVLEAIKK
jgi:glutathione peroxidase